LDPPEGFNSDLGVSNLIFEFSILSLDVR
jgi:hypothetical protein